MDGPWFHPVIGRLCRYSVSGLVPVSGVGLVGQMWVMRWALSVSETLSCARSTLRRLKLPFKTWKQEVVPAGSPSPYPRRLLNKDEYQSYVVRIRLND